MEETPFDMKVAMIRLGGDFELFGMLVRIYQEDGPQLLKELRAALERGDGPNAHRAAHTLKGIAANFEAQSTVLAAARIEQTARAGDLTTAAKDLAELCSLVAELGAALERAVSKDQSGPSAKDGSA